MTYNIVYIPAVDEEIPQTCWTVNAVIGGVATQVLSCLIEDEKWETKGTVYFKGFETGNPEIKLPANSSIPFTFAGWPVPY